MTEEIASQIWKAQTSRIPDLLIRFFCGSCSYVYLVEDLCKKFTLRIADRQNLKVLEGTLYWTSKMGSLGLPIPTITKSNLKDDPPWAITNFIAGKELGQVFRSLTESQKAEIARSVVHCQRVVRQNLPAGIGFGYLKSYEDPTAKDSWKDVVLAHLVRSEEWMAQTGLFGPTYIERLRDLLDSFDWYFKTIQPIPFFDDATTKNVLINDGRFSGLIDLDWICFGDWLYFVALTRMSLLFSGDSPTYSEHLLNEMQIVDLDSRVVDLYTLIFCVDFMGGIGMKFNRESVPVVLQEDQERLTEVYENLMKSFQLTS